MYEPHEDYHDAMESGESRIGHTHSDAGPVWVLRGGMRVPLVELDTTHLYYCVRMAWNTIAPLGKCVGCKNPPAVLYVPLLADKDVYVQPILTRGIAELRKRSDLPVVLRAELQVLAFYVTTFYAEKAVQTIERTCKMSISHTARKNRAAKKAARKLTKSERRELAALRKERADMQRRADLNTLRWNDKHGTCRGC